MTNRVQYGGDGKLDEVVTDGGMHLEAMGDDIWFLLGHRQDGSSIGIHFTGRIHLVEERPAPDPESGPEEMVFGRFRVLITGEGDVVLRRTGALGRGASQEQRMWCIDQIEAALIAARNRRGEDALCQARALEWAIGRLRKKGRAV